MARRRILVSWIGTTDLLSMAADLDEVQQQKVCDAVAFSGTPRKQDGPLRTLLRNESFNQTHLLSNYKPFLNRLFAGWIGGNPAVHSVKLDNPTDYAGIFAAVKQTLDTIEVSDGDELVFFLSPGTPAMAATWILIGKSRHNVSFYQTYDGRAWKTEIPYDVVASFVPELASAPDAGLQHLAAKAPAEIRGFENIIGASKALRLAAGRAEKAAKRDVPVLILGESGTGKEMFARAIHYASHRRGRPFIAINCAAIPQALLESELFGHVKGAFTGASSNRDGAFTLADGGTIFLDEVGECPADMQAKLLRVLQPPPAKGPCFREFTPVGSTTAVHSDVRIVAATNRNLMDDVASGDFREDLFYRLAVITLKLPPLRDRKTDIPPLVDALLAEINADFRNQEPGYRDKSLSDSAKRVVHGYHWPGNVRQLRNTLVEAAVMSAGDTIGVADIKAAVADVPGNKAESTLDQPLGDGFSLQNLLEDIQRHYLDRAMDEAHGVKKRAAELLGIANYQTLDAQIKRLNVTGDWSH
jgi:DNA-binding NtrC family response regulator